MSKISFNARLELPKHLSLPRLRSKDRPSSPSVIFVRITSLGSLCLSRRSIKAAVVIWQLRAEAKLKDHNFVLGFSIQICLKMKLFTFLGFISLVVLVQVAHGAEKTEEEPLQEPEISQKSEAWSANDASQSTESPEPPTNSASESAEGDDKNYALGSLCNYCSYCKVGIYNTELKCASVWWNSKAYRKYGTRKNSAMKFDEWSTRHLSLVYASMQVVKVLLSNRLIFILISCFPGCNASLYVRVLGAIADYTRPTYFSSNLLLPRAVPLTQTKLCNQTSYPVVLQSRSWWAKYWSLS